MLDVGLEPEVAAEPFELGPHGRGREVGGRNASMTSENRAPSARACRSTMFTPCAARQPAIPWMLPGVIGAQDRQDEPLAIGDRRLRDRLLLDHRDRQVEPLAPLGDRRGQLARVLRLGELDGQDDREIPPHHRLAQLEDVPPWSRTVPATEKTIPTRSAAVTVTMYVCMPEPALNPLQV